MTTEKYKLTCTVLNLFSISSPIRDLPKQKLDCPFCKGDRCASLSQDYGTFKCWNTACGITGDGWDLLRTHMKLSWPEAQAFLRDNGINAEIPRRKAWRAFDAFPDE